MADVIYKFKGDASQLISETNRAEKGFGNLQQFVSKAGLEMVGSMFAAGAALEVLKKGFDISKEAAEMAHNVKLIADRLSISATAVMTYNIAAHEAGLESGEWAGSVEKLAKQLVEAGKKPEILETLLRLGVSMEAIKNQNAQQAFEEIGEGLEHIAPSAQRTADLIEILGKKSGTLVNTLKGISAAKDKQGELGHFISEKDINILDEYHKKIDDIGEGLKTFAATWVVIALKGAEAASKLVVQPVTRHDPEKELNDKQKNFNVHQRARANKEALTEKDKEEKAAEAAKEKLETDKKMTTEKEKLSDEISKQNQANKLAQMTDQERLEFLNEQLSRAKAQVDEVNKLKKSSEEWNATDMEAMLSKSKLEGEIYTLQKKMTADDLRNQLKKQKGIDAHADAGNVAGRNLMDSLTSINKDMLDKLVLIEKNTKPLTDRQPSIFPAN